MLTYGEYREVARAFITLSADNEQLRDSVSIKNGPQTINRTVGDD